MSEIELFLSYNHWLHKQRLNEKDRPDADIPDQRASWSVEGLDNGTKRMSSFVLIENIFKKPSKADINSISEL